MDTNRVEIVNETLDSLLSSRKMTVDNINVSYVRGDKNTYFESIDDLKCLADYMAIPLGMFFFNSGESDLDDGVKISRREASFRRDEYRDGVKYYTYEHLVITNQDPNMMALRLDLHSDGSNATKMNDGHQSKEVVYVLKGRVRAEWANEDGIFFSEVLMEGDSIFVSPGVPHSFRNDHQDVVSEILAFNYK